MRLNDNALHRLVLSRKGYAQVAALIYGNASFTNLDPQLNRRVMMVLFFIPLALIALFEVHLDVRRNTFMRQMFTAAQDGEEEDPENRDPEVDHEDGLRISKKSFDEIVKAFPNSFLVSIDPPGVCIGS
jgi:hypothetical protein